MARANKTKSSGDDPPLPQDGGGGASLIVRARRTSRRRAGMSFGAHETVIPLDALSEADVAAIEGDPELIVARVP